MIRVQHLVKSFGTVTAVNDVSFDVAAGEIFAFLGPNGAGKTTTIQMLTTLVPPTSGSMTIDNLDPTRHPHEVRRRFGIVFQDPSLDGELTAYENLEIHGVLYHVPRPVRAERIEALLKLFELWDRRKSIVKTFSGGMKRRLEIARGLLHTPKVLFLDEPTLGLDPQSRNQLWTHVKHLNETEQVTVFLTTHYMDEAERVAQRIAIIDHGRIVAQGSAQELKTQTQTASLEAAFLSLTGTTIRAEHAGVSDRHELPGDADLLPLRRPLPAGRPACRSHYRDASRSADLRDRRTSWRVHRRLAHRARRRHRGAARGGRPVHLARRLHLFEDSRLTAPRQLRRGVAKRGHFAPID
jgi:ABC-2 type transport system ATP-binding protein